jgi:hypothetical protein
MSRFSRIWQTAIVPDEITRGNNCYKLIKIFTRVCRSSEVCLGKIGKHEHPYQSRYPVLALCLLFELNVPATDSETTVDYYRCGKN